MKQTPKNIPARAPMARALVPIVAGIVAASFFTLPTWGAAVGVGIGILAARAARHRVTADIYICLALFMAGWFAAEIRYDPPHIPEGEGLAEIAVDDIVARRDRAVTAEGRLVAFTTDGDTLRHSRRIRISASPSLDLSAGDRLVVLCRIKPYSRRSDDGYERYMARRGFAGQATIRPQNVMKRHTGKASFGSRMRARAVERIGRLGLPPETEALTHAVAVGDRSGITPEMRRRHSLAGTAHLLAVSGLHVGFVFAMVNLLLWWMPLLRRGHLLRCAAAVAAIWLYAAAAGFSPSVTRAAVMFTVLQLSMGLSVRSDTMNSLAFTACIMLLFDARNLWDAGFLMSFAAVAAIIGWGIPLGRIGRRQEASAAEKHAAATRRGPARVTRATRYAIGKLWSAVAISLAAAMGTMPLAALFFGSVSFWSIVTGPAAMLPSAVLLCAALVWSLAPLPVLAPAVARIITVSGGALEALTRWCASAGVLSFEIGIDAAACVAVYAVFIAATFWLRRQGK